MSPPKALELVTRLRRMPHVRNIEAQADARYLLFTVGEDPANFPRFLADLDDQATMAAYSYLNAGCALAENGLRSEAAGPLLHGAVLLEQVNAPKENRAPGCTVHLLISAMAFYAAGHYSRAFVVMRSLEPGAAVARLIARFLGKRYGELLQEINEVLLGEDYSDRVVANDAERTEEDTSGLGADGRVMTVLVGRALSLALEFIYSGDSLWIRHAEEVLEDAMGLATAGFSPMWWWVARLLRLALSDLHTASPWTVLPSYFAGRASAQLRDYVRILAYQRIPGSELWRSQREALPRVLDLETPGAVVSLPTSAGKTRVAETAILQCLVSNPAGKVLYVAPFRSLAFEVERSLTATIGALGYTVSHLYGGGRASNIDRALADEAHVIVATPEKTKALLRAVSDLWSSIRLAVVDEGHLLGASPDQPRGGRVYGESPRLERRLVRNEIFLEQLRAMCKKTGARILLLSAVLPNVEEMAVWIGGQADAVARSGWRPSDQRVGYLQWTGQVVRLQWLGQTQSFNPNFIVARPVRQGRMPRPFPRDKTEAVAAAAIRLSEAGTVLIFTGSARSIGRYAKALVTALGDAPSEHSWPQSEWELFVASCRECYPREPVELTAARYGILCHSGKLPDQVRAAMEHLMRARAPRVIVATTTLAQGVNIGVSTVIVANPWIEGTPLRVRDFWNVAGRAGRAFVDAEGRILVTIDLTRDQKRVKRDLEMAKRYFDRANSEPVMSGILAMFLELHDLAVRAGVDFELLLGMVAENDFGPLGHDAVKAREYCDLLDDVLLALHCELEEIHGSDPFVWIDDVFRNSLAAVCARRSDSPLEPEDVVSFLKHRARAVAKFAGDRKKWPLIVASGLPLSAAVALDQAVPDLKRALTELVSSSGELNDLDRFVSFVEGIIRSFPGDEFSATPGEEILRSIRQLWLSGRPLREILPLNNRALEICRDHYGYRVPWVMNAAARYLAAEGSSEAEVCDRVALMVEIGVPTEIAAKVFMCGIRSRTAAVELSAYIPEEVARLSLSRIAEYMGSQDFVDSVQGRASPDAMLWLQNLVRSMQKPRSVPQIPEFRIRADPFPCSTIHVRKREGRVFLCSPDYRQTLVIGAPPDSPWHELANDLRVALERRDSGAWRLDIRDPRVRP
ncbi:MAG: DEAD/DEAH box helicase [Bacillota bacterium]